MSPTLEVTLVGGLNKKENKTMSIVNSTMIANLHLGFVGRTKKDRVVTDDINTQHNASKDAGSYVKELYSKQDIKAIIKIANNARHYHTSMTLPWGDYGDRLLPSKHYMQYSHDMNDYVTQFNAGVQSFINKYAQVVHNAQRKLNNLFNVNDYADPEIVKKRFYMKVDIRKVSTSNDFRIDIQEEELNKLRMSIENQFKESQVAAMENLWYRLYKPIEKLSTKLTEDKPRIFDSLIGNIIQITEILPALNIANDSTLQELCNEIQSTICTISTKELRKSPTIRNDARITANEIINKMDGYIGTV